MWDLDGGTPLHNTALGTEIEHDVCIFKSHFQQLSFNFKGNNHHFCFTFQSKLLLTALLYFILVIQRGRESLAEVKTKPALLAVLSEECLVAKEIGGKSDGQSQIHVNVCLAAFLKMWSCVRHATTLDPSYTPHSTYFLSMSLNCLQRCLLRVSLLKVLFMFLSATGRVQGTEINMAAFTGQRRP